MRTPRLHIATELHSAKGLWSTDAHATDFHAAHVGWSEEHQDVQADQPLQDRMRSRKIERHLFREHRRHELEQQLREQLGVPEDVEEPGSPSDGERNLSLVVVDARGANSRPCSANRAGANSTLKQIVHRPPARPPKPPPYRGPSTGQDVAAVVADGVDAAKPTTVRWTSSLKSVWPDRLQSEETEVSSPKDSTPMAIMDAEPIDVPSPTKKEVRPPANIGMSAVAVVQAAKREEEKRIQERTRHLEQNAQRLRENMERLRCHNRRGRIFTSRGRTGEEARSVPPPQEGCADSTPHVVSSAISSSKPLPPAMQQHFTEMRRKIEELDELNAIEQERLLRQQEEMDARRREQLEFERTVQEQTERDKLARREREESAERALKLKEDQDRREREERTRKWREKQRLDEDRSKRLEENCQEARSDAALLKWQLLEEELDRQWAADEAAEQRRMQEYASIRRRQYEEWDRQLTSERQRFGLEAEWREAAHIHKARNAADSDEKFYGPQRAAAPSLPTPSGPGRPSSHRASPQVVLPEVAISELPPEEQMALKELRSVIGASRDKQKAKVKELLKNWHPDKNPDCTEKAKRVFQFVQKQRGLVLGL
mmetsp:Transcript_44501/g.81285  ORF Transcript_44501/g.81285 Transcript_44501/m.81285 type:complete len:601 (-) Transcript_44501:46-1848(-)